MNTETSHPANPRSAHEATLMAETEAESELKAAAPSHGFTHAAAHAPVVGVVAMMAVALPLVFALHSNPQAAQSASGGATHSATAIAWNTSLDCARQIALSSGKMMMIVFVTEACPACREMEREVFERAAIIAEAQLVVTLKIDVELQPQIAAHYHVETCPTIVWADAEGTEKHRADQGLNGYELYQAMQQFH